MNLDTFKLWKCGESIRLDYNLVGINGIRAKKRDMSLIFNPTGGFQTKEMQNFHGNSRNSKRFWIVNRTKKTFTNPLVCRKNRVFSYFVWHFAYFSKEMWGFCCISNKYCEFSMKIMLFSYKIARNRRGREEKNPVRYLGESAGARQLYH